MNGKRTIASSLHGALALLFVLSALSCFHPDRPHPDMAVRLESDLDSLDQPCNSTGEFSGTSLVVRVFYRPLPAKMPGAEADTPEMVALGRQLFFEPGMSATKTQACNDCHHLDDNRAGADDQPVSRGARGLFGDRNSPTVLNAGFHLAEFWDGRAADLVEQAKGPVLNPKEMAMASAADLEGRLKDHPEYPALFARAFPGQPKPVTFDNVARAIAAFERTLVTPARFDRFVAGDPAALSREEKRGLQRFVVTGCIECHTDATVGGRLFEKVGRFHPYANRTDLGRFAVTQREEDRYVFKVPSLRNVTLTPPYFQDGQVSSLNEAARLMAWMQLDKSLTPDETAEIVRFLRTLEMEHPVDVGGK